MGLAPWTANCTLIPVMELVKTQALWLNGDKPAAAEASCPALVLGSGLTGVGVLRSLSRAGIPTYSICEPGDLPTRSRWYRAAPQTSDCAVEPQDLAEYLGRGLLEKAVLVPCSDNWTKAVANLPGDLKVQFPASVASGQVIETLTDKWRFAETLERVGVPRPKSILLHSLREMSNLPESCYENMFLKPLDSQEFSSHTGVKAWRPQSKSHALQLMTEMGARGFPILLQEYIPGPAGKYYLVDGFIDRNRRLRALFARRRHRMYPLGFGNSTLSETIPLEQVSEPIATLERIWADLDYRGIFDAEFKYDDRDGHYKIVEINPRPWWFVEFAVRCGVDLCQMCYQDALGLPVDPAFTFPVGRACVYLGSDFRAHLGTDPGLGGFLRWIASLKGTEEIIYSWDDPGPGIFSTLTSLKNSWTRLKKKRTPAIRPASLEEPMQVALADRKSRP